MIHSAGSRNLKISAIPSTETGQERADPEQSGPMPTQPKAEPYHLNAHPRFTVTLANGETSPSSDSENSRKPAPLEPAAKVPLAQQNADSKKNVASIGKTRDAKDKRAAYNVVPPKEPTRRESIAPSPTPLANTPPPPKTRTTKKDNDVIDDVIISLRLAISANPNDPFAWYGLGVRCYAQKDTTEALQCFERAEMIKHGFSAANYYYMALCHHLAARNTECVENLRKACSIKAINKVDKKGRGLAHKMLMTLEAKNHQIVAK